MLIQSQPQPPPTKHTPLYFIPHFILLLLLALSPSLTLLTLSFFYLFLFCYLLVLIPYSTLLHCAPRPLSSTMRKACREIV
ncbi:hypothetical protein BDV95DRAFT_581966 [Massariosphaeria phaeospora]|uniref:Uncharacterized protein n=1 Tax=Massariosphaeria phaeospora TaxID=100035 RepID=A0A7C8I0G6_9PLEO|nr:hypothetical protein BDV95DRAFT_581966 [Massariosphaeria phaeospora]